MNSVIGKHCCHCSAAHNNSPLIPRLCAARNRNSHHPDAGASHLRPVTGAFFRLRENEMQNELKEKIEELRERAWRVYDCAQRADRTDDYRREMAKADALFAQVAALEKEIAA